MDSSQEIALQIVQRFGEGIHLEWLNQSRLAALSKLATKYQIPVEETLEEQERILRKTLESHDLGNPKILSKQEKDDANALLTKAANIAGLVTL